MVWLFSLVWLDRPVAPGPGSTDVICSPGAAMVTHGPHTLNCDGAPVGSTEATETTSEEYTGGICTWYTLSGLGSLFCGTFWHAVACWPFWSALPEVRLPAAATTT